MLLLLYGDLLCILLTEVVKDLHLIFEHSQNPPLLHHMQSDPVGGILHLEPDLGPPLRAELLHVDQQADVVVDRDHVVGQPVVVSLDQVCLT